jgi:hypothetical protein
MRIEINIHTATFRRMSNAITSAAAGIAAGWRKQHNHLKLRCDLLPSWRSPIGRGAPRPVRRRLRSQYWI